MKLATLTVVAFALLTAGLSMGCSSGRMPVVRADTGVVVTVDTGGRIDSGAITPTDAPPIMTIDTGVDAPPPPRVDAGTLRCVASCTSDSQCATSCPANPRGANCCDTLAGVCYAAMVPVCPVTMMMDDAGGS